MKQKITTICVFCGANPGHNPAYIEAAKALGPFFAKHNLKLVYGGGGTGMMGTIAQSALDAGVHVTGVQPRFLDERELTLPGLNELVLVDSMHERKNKMAELSDAFVALPGGIGTLEELFEVYTWAQLGLHQKPVGLLNIEGYYSMLIGFMDHMVQEGYLHDFNRAILQQSSTYDGLLQAFQEYEAPDVERWLTPKRT